MKIPISILPVILSAVILVSCGTDKSVLGTSIGKRKQRMYPKIIDFKTGIRTGYSLQSLTYFIKKDAQLHAAFLNEPKRIEMMFIYLMKYNYRNPIYFQYQQR